MRRPHIEANGMMPVTFDNIDIATQTAWIQGFMSAFNYYASESGDVSGGTDANGVFAWIDSYCAGHPIDIVATAAIALITELSQR